MTTPPLNRRGATQAVTRLWQRLPPALRAARLRLRVQAGLAIGLAVGLLVCAIYILGLLAPVDPFFTDLLYQPVKANDQVAIIAIDKKSLDALGPWPWPRALHAALLNRLANAPPRVIAFDVLFSQPASDDSTFAAAIRNSGNVILSAIGVEAAAFPLKPGSLPEFDVVVQPASDLRQAAALIAHRMVTRDSDQIVRRVPLGIQANNTRYPALGLAAAQVFRQSQAIQYDPKGRYVTVSTIDIPTDEMSRALLNFTGMQDGIATYSYSDVLAGNVPASSFAGKIVFIGGVTTTEAETFATPLRRGESRAYSVQVQADLANMLVSSPPRLLREQGSLGQIALILVIGLLAGLTLPHLRPFSAAAVTLLYLLALLLAAFEAFNFGVVVKFQYPALALIMTFGLIAVFRYFSEERRRYFLTILFRRYLPADSVGQVVEAVDRGELPLGGTRRMVTVLYLDLRGFAALSEGLAPEAVLGLVNRYLELVLRAIQAEGGTVNKPMGDALVAIWNAPLDQPDHASRAVRAAVEIRRHLMRFQKSRPEDQVVNFGIGLATGWAVLGNISALGRVEYTLIGETVNVAARISAFASNNQILADRGTADAAPDNVELRELTPVRVRGRKEPLNVWEVRDPIEIKAEELEELQV